MGNATAARSFALSGGAAGSLVGAAVTMLVVLGAILAFNATDRPAAGPADGSLEIQGAPEAAAQSVAPATRSVASTPAPIPDPAPVSTRLIVSAAPAPVPLAPPATRSLPPIELPPGTAPPPSPEPDCVLGEFLPECVKQPPNPSVSGVVGGVSGGLDATTQQLLGLDLGLEELTAPLGETLDKTVGGLADTLQPPLKNTTDSVVGGLNQTLTGVGGLLEILGNK